MPFRECLDMRTMSAYPTARKKLRERALGTRFAVFAAQDPGGASLGSPSRRGASRESGSHAGSRPAGHKSDSSSHLPPLVVYRHLAGEPEYHPVIVVRFGVAPLIWCPYADDAGLLPASDSSDHSETGGADPMAIAVARAHWPRGRRD